MDMRRFHDHSRRAHHCTCNRSLHVVQCMCGNCMTVVAEHEDCHERRHDCHKPCHHKCHPVCHDGCHKRFDCGRHRGCH